MARSLPLVLGCYGTCVRGGLGDCCHKQGDLLRSLQGGSKSDVGLFRWCQQKDDESLLAEDYSHGPDLIG